MHHICAPRCIQSFWVSLADRYFKEELGKLPLSRSSPFPLSCLNNHINGELIFGTYTRFTELERIMVSVLSRGKFDKNKK